MSRGGGRRGGADEANLSTSTGQDLITAGGKVGTLVSIVSGTLFSSITGGATV